jgi:hypothetical protein
MSLNFTAGLAGLSGWASAHLGSAGQQLAVNWLAGWLGQAVGGLLGAGSIVMLILGVIILWKPSAAGRLAGLALVGIALIVLIPSILLMLGV